MDAVTGERVQVEAAGPDRAESPGTAHPVHLGMDHVRRGAVKVPVIGKTALERVGIGQIRLCKVQDLEDLHPAEPRPARPCGLAKGHPYHFLDGRVA